MVYTLNMLPNSFQCSLFLDFFCVTIISDIVSSFFFVAFLLYLVSLFCWFYRNNLEVFFFLLYALEQFKYSNQLSFKIIIEFTHKALCSQWLLKSTLWQFQYFATVIDLFDFISLLGSIWELFSYLETIQFFVIELIHVKLTKLSYDSNLWLWLFFSFLFSLSNCLGNTWFIYFNSFFKEPVFKCIY